MDPSAAHRVQTALTTLLTDQGRTVLSRPDRLRAGLADLLGADRTETEPYVDALVTLAQAGEATTLQHPRPNLVGVTETMRRTRPDMDPEAAWWAARTVHTLVAPPPSGPTRLGDAGAGPVAMAGAPWPPPPGTVLDAPPPSTPATRRRWTRPLVAAVALLAVAGASTGITYASTRASDPVAASSGPAEGRAPGGVVTETSVGTTTATVTTTETASKPIRTTVTAVVTTVRTVDPLAQHRTVLCESGRGVLDDARTAINGWATGESSTANATRSRNSLNAAARRFDQLVATVRGPADSSLTVTSGLLSVALRDLATVVGRGGTSAYSLGDWSAALARKFWIEQGFYAECGSGTIARTDRAAITKACGILRTPLSTMDKAVTTWAATLDGEDARSVQSPSADLEQSILTVLWGGPGNDRILFSTPLGRALTLLDHWRYNVGAKADQQPGEAPPAEWMSGWRQARDATRAACA